MCFIELVDYNEAMLATKDGAKVKTTRRKRAPSKKKVADEGEVKAEESKPKKTASKKEAAPEVTQETEEEKAE